MSTKIVLPETLLAGRHEPMGSHVRDGGVNFAVFSQSAERIELCLFDVTGSREIRRYELTGPHDGIFHGFLPGAAAGLVYGLRAYGPYDPERGHRFNPHKLLLDPWAREIAGSFSWRAEHHGYTLGHPGGWRSFDDRDNATQALKARVATPASRAVAASSAPRTALSDVVLYEVHVKGFSQQHPDIPAACRGRYAGLAQPASIEYFKSLGVTTLSLLPVQYHLDEPGLASRGASNYWGYNTLGFFCADPRFAMQPDDPAAVNEEFRHMVATLHDHGLEVVLDVVYNHTAEGSEAGPTLSFRGLDNANWYRLMSDDPSRCENLTGCGNTLNVAHPRVTQFVLDSLRYWVEEMGVDGFRFDLAPVLGRTRHGYDPDAAFFAALRQDPVLAKVHLIAEPWDAGYQGYQLGRFPGRFMEWNDKFRDAVRAFWLHRGAGRGEIARRFSGSSDLFHHGQRQPTASVNFVAVHDGFTLADVVSYSRKHNHANGEDNLDGRDGESCANFGAEGPTDDAAIRTTRARVQRAMLATLLLAQGTPMICAGDEIGRSQRGNNNAYCLDDATNWLDWTHQDHDLREFVSTVLALRRAEPALRNDHWFAAHPSRDDYSLVWRNPHGQPMSIHDWHDADNHAFACQIFAPEQPSTTQAGSAQLLLMFNPHPYDIAFVLPAARWRVALDSSRMLLASPGLTRDALTVPGHTLVALCLDAA